jgi:hypothetical protein
VARVDVLPKRGRFTNEFSAYRYEAVLRFGPKVPSITPSWIDWTPEWTLDAIGARLSAAPADRLSLRGVVNLRLEPDVLAWRLIRDRACSTVAELRARTARRAPHGLSPEDLHLLAERAGVRVQLSLASGDPEGRFDAVFDRSTEPVAWPDAAPGAPAFNEPGLNVRRQALVGALLLHVQPLLDPASLPASLTVAERLPPRE